VIRNTRVSTNRFLKFASTDRSISPYRAQLWRKVADKPAKWIWIFEILRRPGRFSDELMGNPASADGRIGRRLIGTRQPRRARDWDSFAVSNPVCCSFVRLTRQTKHRYEGLAVVDCRRVFLGTFGVNPKQFDEGKVRLPMG
jgi:hypothetical protein